MPRFHVWSLMVNQSRRAGLMGLALSGGMLLTSTALAGVDPLKPVMHQFLDAGEYGLAMEVVAVVRDPEVQAEFLAEIAEAQVANGDAAAARGTIRRISDRTARQEAARRQAEIASSQGGASLANFAMLMQLIQQNTSGQWEEVDGEGGAMSPFFTGVRVDAKGVLERQAAKPASRELGNIRDQSRVASVNTDMAQQSSLRLVSLKRLEAEVARRISEGQAVPESMERLAGLTSVQYVMAFPEQNDIVIGGPAEGWEHRPDGAAVGTVSQKPTLRLDDLVTLVRTFANGGEFGCSINVRESGVKQLQEFVKISQSKGPMQPAAVKNWVQQMQQKLGRQDIVVWGVPADSRVARVIVEADYRMKLVGIDKLDLAPEVPSYFDLLPVALQKEGNMDALRWWLTLNCDAIGHSPDRMTFEIQNATVRCQSENQALTADGKHVSVGKTEATNRQFAENFTNHYDRLSDKDPVFADAKNIFDLALVAAVITHEKLDAKAHCELPSFEAGGLYEPEHLPAPKEVESVVNHRVYHGRDIVVQVAGGVQVAAADVVRNPAQNVESPRLGEVGKNAAAPELPAGRWWWDAK